MSEVVSPPVPLVLERQGRRAGFVSRVLADLVDLLVVQGSLLGALVGYAIVRYLLFGGSLTFPRPPLGITSGVDWIVLTTYLGVGWATTGRTAGKVLLGLRVVTATGRSIGARRAIARAALCAAVGPVLLAWVLVSRRNAGIHDLILRTAVLYAWGPHALARG